MNIIPKSLIRKYFERTRGNELLKVFDFEVGMVIQMEPGYYTSKPYYVLVKEVTQTGITTTIPGYHDLNLDRVRDIITWEHQVARMTIVGTKETHGHLLENQKVKPEDV